jgi:hypothetical protein
VSLTLRPGQPGANRIPTAAHLALMLANLQGVFPADDGQYAIALVSSPVKIVLKVLWTPGAYGWADTNVFPLYVSPGNNWNANNAGGSLTMTSTTFNLKGGDAEVPQVGQSIALFDQANLVFRRKKILTAVVDGVHGGYTVTVDTAGGISDTSYTPFNGQLVSPWSDGLANLILPVVTYMDTLGPGEMFSSFFDPGLRQKRSPASPQLWPSQLTQKLIGGGVVPQPPQGPAQNLPPVQTLLTTPGVQDVQIVEPTTPYATPVGSPGISANLLTIGDFAVYSE